MTVDPSGGMQYPKTFIIQGVPVVNVSHDDWDIPSSGSLSVNEHLDLQGFDPDHQEPAEAGLAFVNIEEG